jgi:predicted DNA-binding transcriptional regulator YafY
MLFEKIKNRLQQLDQLIALKATGKPESLARRLGISKNTLFSDIRALRDMGAPIKYDRYRETYFYEEDGRVRIEAVFWKKSEKK